MKTLNNYFLKIIFSKNFPLPSNLLSWMTDDSEIKEDPDKHDGRIRSFKHERGNWATFVYIKCEKFNIICNYINYSLVIYLNFFSRVFNLKSIFTGN